MSNFKMLKVSELILDRNNPRIQAALEFYNSEDIDDVKIGMALGANSAQFEGTGTTYQSLRDSIKTHGSIFNPIIVNNSEEGYIVVEGNTRVHIYRDFLKNQTPGSWDSIPAIVYENADKIDMDAIRLQAHLVGPREWDAYSKAKYLHRLSEKESMSMNQIIDFCGGKKKDIEQYITGYKLMEEYYRPILNSDQEFDKSRFSAFIEVQKSNIPNVLVANQFSFADFAKWIYADKFEPLNTIRQLPRIFSSTKAKDIFIKKNAKAAIKELDSLESGALDINKVSLSVLMGETAKKIRKIEYEQLQTFRSDRNFVDKVHDLFDELNNFINEFQEED